MYPNLPSTDQPDLEDDMARRGIDGARADLMTGFARDGYAIIDLELPDFAANAAAIIEELGPVYDFRGRIQDAWRTNANVRTLACLEQITDTLALLYGRRAFPFQTLNFPHGTQQRSHADTIHFHSVPERFMAGVWIALESTDQNNGPLEYYPGSHKLPCYTLADAGIRGSDVTPGNYDLYRDVYQDFIQGIIAANGFRKYEAHLRAGQALIWAANLIHGGGPILQPGRSRHSQVTHYFFDDCLYYTPLHSDPMIGKIHHRQPVNIATGRPVQSQYCGQLFSPPPPNLLTRAKRRLRRSPGSR